MSAEMMLTILPEIGLVALIILVLALDAIDRGNNKRYLGVVTFCGILIIAVAGVVFARPASAQMLWGGMLRFDDLSFVFRTIFLVGAGLTVLFAVEDDTLGGRGEAYALLLTATLGMCLMASAADLVMLYLAIETTSIPLYVLAGFLTKDQKSTESGIKYLLFGAFTSAVMLYGFSMVYGFAGTTHLYEIAKLSAGPIPFWSLLVVLVLILVGVGFKVSAAPFHFWAPDVYEGAPTSVAGFLSTASKAAGFAVLLRILLAAFPNMTDTWSLLVAILATASMFIGNLLALAQKNIKRLLAYSSIAQAGYMLIGVAAHSELGTSGTVYYLMSYLVTNLAAFGIISVVGRAVGSDEISAYAGLKHRSPGLALLLLVAFLSLGGIPPFSGFVGKMLVFAAAIQSNLVWLAILGVINSIIALYYYLVVIKTVYLYRSEQKDKPIVLARAWQVGLVVCLAGILVIGTIMFPWYEWSSKAASALAIIKP